MTSCVTVTRYVIGHPVFVSISYQPRERALFNKRCVTTGDFISRHVVYMYLVVMPLSLQKPKLHYFDL